LSEDTFMSLGDAMASAYSSKGDICDRAFLARAHGMRALPSEMRAEAIREVEKVIHLCESPIEQVALYQFAGFNFGNDEHPSRARVLRKRGEIEHYPDLIHFIPQAVFGRFRLDFLIDAGSMLFALECDGQEFHQQQWRDRQRDDILLRDYRVKVYRVPGTSIWAGGNHVHTIASIVKGSVFP